MSRKRNITHDQDGLDDIDSLDNAFDRFTVNDQYDVVIIPKVKRAKKPQLAIEYNPTSNIEEPGFGNQMVNMMFRYHEILMGKNYNKIMDRLDMITNKITEIETNIKSLEEKIMTKNNSTENGCPLMTAYIKLDNF